MTPFKPIGTQARWQQAYELLQVAETGDTVTYVALGERMDLDPEEQRHQIQMAMRRAAKEHEQVDKRAIESVPNVGYRIVLAPEHMVLAKRQQSRASRALKSGQSKVINVDFNLIEPETRKAFEVIAAGFALQADMMRRFDVRSKRLEQSIESFTESQQSTNEEYAERLARLEETLQRHGIATDQPKENAAENG